MDQLDPALHQFLASHLVTDMRQGKIPSTDVAAAVNRTPWIDVLRGEISLEDFSWIHQLCGSPDSAHAALGISLLRTIQDDAQVRDFLEDLWRTREEYEIRWWTMFRLMAYEDLDTELLESMYGYTTQNWDQWISDCKSFFGADLAADLRARVLGGGWPASTSWVRVLQAAGVEDANEGRELIEQIKARNPSAPLVDRAVEFSKNVLSKESS